MTYLPRVLRLDVQGYAMYPGTDDSPGLHRDILPGITLVVGANGLGKTTLITLLRHLCAGPARLGNRTGASFEAGRLRTTAVDLETFADRVSDRATGASATIVMEVGSTTFQVTRNLRNLALQALIVSGTEVEPDEGRFQEEIVTAAEVTDYADWLLLVDYLMFVTEDRSQPFWDRNVQRQLLRVLTSGADAAGAQSEAESRHISADSEFRNARAQLNRHKQRFETLASKVAGSNDVNDALVRLSAEREDLQRQVASLEERLVTAQGDHTEAVREQEVAETERQIAMESLEAARFALIESALPSQDEVLRYLTARMATSDNCPVCGQHGGDLPSIVEDARCFLCGLEVREQVTEVDGDMSEWEARIDRADRAISANAGRLAERAQLVADLDAELAGARSRRIEIDGRVRALRARLPSGSTDLGSTAALIADLEDDLEELRSALEESRAELQDLLQQSNSAIQGQQDEIRRVFDEVATMFLVERCHLVPHESAVRIGQEGERFSVQAFDLNLGSATNVGESRRDTADEVSESQRVFIDIAFRIALIDVCVGARSGTMVIDAPEGSLDAVFSLNAADLLNAFSAMPSAENRLIVASNLVEGSLLPGLAKRAGIASIADARLINLLAIAAPTAAVVQRGDEYHRVLISALEGAIGDGQ